MKKIVLTSIILIYAFILNAQNQRIYVMRGGESVADYDINTDIDSIIFYDPGTINPPSENVPFFDLSTTQIKIGAGAAPSGEFNTNYGRQGAGTNGVPQHYAYLSPIAETWVGLEVVFPPSYNTQPTKKYPVVYHLHGRGERETTTDTGNIFATAYNAMTTNATPEFIYISVGGPQLAWWSDNVANTVKAESHIIYEILSLVDQTFRTLPKKGSRAIEGFSMGGFGATKIAFKYPQYFRAVGSFCGALYSYPGGDETQLMIGNWGFKDDYNNIWQGNVDRYKNDNSRYHANTNAAKIKSNSLDILVCSCGDGYAPFSVGLQNDLIANDIPHEYRAVNAGHALNAIQPDKLAIILKNLETQ